MVADPQPRNRRPASSAAVVRYAVVWLGAVAIVAAVALVVRPAGQGNDLPPVRQIQLERAARTAGCELRRGAAAERLNPPAASPGSAPAPGTYDKSLSARAVTAALRRGIVVIQYRRGISGDVLDRLTAIRSLVPQGTILAPFATAVPFEVAASAWRRLVGCRRFSASAIDALRLFRGRFLGSGPDA
jgi:hypothetical protein